MAFRTLRTVRSSGFPLSDSASGVLERFPKLRFATIEAGIGWVAWVVAAMDEAYRKHHNIRDSCQLPISSMRKTGMTSPDSLSTSSGPMADPD